MRRKTRLSKRNAEQLSKICLTNMNEKVKSYTLSEIFDVYSIGGVSMRKKKKAMARAGVALLLSSSMAMNALASTVTTTGTVDVETTAGNKESIDVTIVTEKTENVNGSTTVHTSSNATGFVTESGCKVDYNSESDSVTGESSSKYSSKLETEDSIYTAEGGSQTTVSTNPTGPNAGAVDIPLTSEEGKNSDTELGANEVGTSNTSGDTDKTDGEYDYTANNTAEGGSQTTVSTNPTGPNTGAVDIPLTSEEGKNSDTELGANEVGTSNTSGDTDKTDGEYDYTTNTVVGQGSVTVTTEEIKIEENVEQSDMEYVKSETTPNETNDLVYVDEAPEEYQPGYTGDPVIPEGTDGYEYVYVGSGNTSKYVPAIVFNTPLSDEDKLAQYGENAYIKNNSITYYYVGCLPEQVKATIAKDDAGNYVTDTEGYILNINGERIFKEELTTKGPDGETLYLHRFDRTGNGHKVEGWYGDSDKDGYGEWVDQLNGTNQYVAVWAGPQQFILVDSQGKVITTYCADFATPTQDAYGYNVENLEDATYYSDEEAARIRSIVKNGYWGTVGNVVDENGNETTTPKVGSLAAMKEALASAGFTEEELSSLNDGVALTATQMAIWSCSNKMSGIEFINAHYSDWGTGNVPSDKEDEVVLMFKIYEYLTHLPPTEVENTTADTIINEDNFLSDMTLTVVNKAEGHENNKDDNDDNDAYVTNLTFALVVTPSTERGDDLIVKVINGHGTVLATGRLAGDLKDGETLLTPDGEGNYAFTNITMVEGEHNFNITLEGIQNLEHGVYLYSSQVQDGTSSQTMVGMAEGERAVNVSMNIEFELNVEDEVIVTEHVWREEEITSKPPKNDPPQKGDGGDGGSKKKTIVDNAEIPLASEPVVEIEESDVPLSADPAFGEFMIEDDLIPLAALPATGDNSSWFMFMSLLSGLSLAGASLVDKMKKRKR